MGTGLSRHSTASGDSEERTHGATKAKIFLRFEANHATHAFI